MAMGDCIPVRPFASDPLIECLAEIRMIWKDKNEDLPLISLRLYFLPENTPKGRDGHGEDELIAVKDLDAPKGRIVIRAEDFMSWLVDDLVWNWGLVASYHEQSKTKLLSSSSGIPTTSLLSNSILDLGEVDVEKRTDGNMHTNVTVLSYSRYCRYRAAIKRLEHIEDNDVRTKLIETLGGFVASQPNTRIMFAKETFECPEMDSHEMLCPHLAPKLKGRPRGRRKKVTSRVSEHDSSPAPSSEFSVSSNETNDSDVFDGKHLMKNKDLYQSNSRLTRNKTKSEATPEMFTTLSTGRVSKQRLPLTPLKASTTNKRKRKSGAMDDDAETSSDDDDEDYEDKNSNKKVKQEKRNSKSSKGDNGNEDYNRPFTSISQHLPMLQLPFETYKNPEEIDFLIRLNTFMAERSQSYPKLIWGLKDVNLFTIYTRVQKLGGFNAIADNRVWKNLFEDLSEPGKCITQGMTKRKYERILLPFERYERELRENGKGSRSELTISTIPRTTINKKVSELQQNPGRRQSSSSPAIEIIPLKNGAVKNELTVEQMSEIQKIIKPGHSDYNTNDVSVPVHVIVRPSPNGSMDTNSGSSRAMKTMSGVGGQKENIPLSTTVVPMSRDGQLPHSGRSVVDLIDSDDDDDSSRTAPGGQQMKKRKLDILREGGLEVTPISRRVQMANAFASHPPVPSSSRQTMQPNVSLMSLAPVRAPPVIQSLNMYQSTRQVFKNPKDEIVNATRNSKSYCLDLTSNNKNQPSSSASSSQSQQYPQANVQQAHSQGKKNLLSIEEVQRAYRGSNPDLQITLVKPHNEPHSSGSISNSNHPPVNNNRKPKNSNSSSQATPPINPALIAAANELQKLQQQNLHLFPFLSNLDITPMQNQQSSKGMAQSQPSPVQMNASLMSYLSALYATNPLLRGQNIFSNLSGEFLKQLKNPSNN